MGTGQKKAVQGSRFEVPGDVFITRNFELGIRAETLRGRAAVPSDRVASHASKVRCPNSFPRWLSMVFRFLRSTTFRSRITVSDFLSRIATSLHLSQHPHIQIRLRRHEGRKAVHGRRQWRSNPVIGRTFCKVQLASRN